MRLQLLAGSRLTSVTLPEDAEVLRPPPPLDPLADVRAATLEALRYPLAGPPLERLVARGARATVVVDAGLLPLPVPDEDPRRDALAAVVDELDRHGARTTIIVAGGLERRAGRARLEALLRPERARAFRGKVVTHDCESERLLPLGEIAGTAVRVAPELLETDLVVTVTAAETVLHGGPAALVAATAPGLQRAAAAESLLETGTSSGWRAAVALEAFLARSVPLLGVSLVLDLPRPALPHGPARLLLNRVPAPTRYSWLERSLRPVRVASVLAGTPSVAHAEGLIRGTALRGVRLAGRFDTIVVPLPWSDAHRPRSPASAVTSAAIGLGLALRLWRDVHPLQDGGTVVLVGPLTRTTDLAPFRRLFAALRDGERLRRAEAAASRDPRALAAYRAGRAAHPRLPFADWDGCSPALQRAGRVIVAGSRDAAAARALGFVPGHSPAAALEMAVGVAGTGARTAVLAAPPYAPLLAG